MLSLLEYLPDTAFQCVLENLHFDEKLSLLQCSRLTRDQVLRGTTPRVCANVDERAMLRAIRSAMVLCGKASNGYTLAVTGMTNFRDIFRALETRQGLRDFSQLWKTTYQCSLQFSTLLKYGCCVKLTSLELVGLRLTELVPQVVQHQCPALRSSTLQHCVLAPKDMPERRLHNLNLKGSQTLMDDTFIGCGRKRDQSSGVVGSIQSTSAGEHRPVQLKLQDLQLYILNNEWDVLINQIDGAMRETSRHTEKWWPAMSVYSKLQLLLASAAQVHSASLVDCEQLQIGSECITSTLQCVQASVGMMQEMVNGSFATFKSNPQNPAGNLITHNLRPDRQAPFLNRATYRIDIDLLLQVIPGYQHVRDVDVQERCLERSHRMSHVIHNWFGPVDAVARCVQDLASIQVLRDRKAYCMHQRDVLDADMYDLLAQLQHLTSLSIHNLQRDADPLTAAVKPLHLTVPLVKFEMTSTCDDDMFSALLQIPTLRHAHLRDVQLDQSYADAPCKWETLAISCYLALHLADFNVISKLPLHSLTSPLEVGYEFTSILWPADDQKRVAMEALQAVLQNVSKCGGVCVNSRYNTSLRFVLHEEQEEMEWQYTQEDDRLMESVPQLFCTRFWDRIEYEDFQFCSAAWTSIKTHFILPSVLSVVLTCIVWREEDLATLLPSLPAHVTHVTFELPVSDYVDGLDLEPGCACLDILRMTKITSAAVRPINIILDIPEEEMDSWEEVQHICGNELVKFETLDDF